MTTGEPGAQPGEPHDGQEQPQARASQPSFDKPAEPAWASSPPQYGQAPAYGQYGPQYGPPQAGYGPPPSGGYGVPAPEAPPEQKFGIVGAVVAFTGAVLVVLALTVLTWFSTDKVSRVFRAAGNRTFREVHDALEVTHDNFPAQLSRYVDFGISRAYFGWLAWLLLAVAVVVAILALLPTPAPFLRVLGLLIGLAAVAITFWAIDLISLSGPVAKTIRHNPSYSDYLSHTNVGFWFAVVGFLLIGVGALIGPRRT
jgi:hypothetical protein